MTRLLSSVSMDTIVLALRGKPLAVGGLEFTTRITGTGDIPIHPLLSYPDWVHAWPY